MENDSISKTSKLIFCLRVNHDSCLFYVALEVKICATNITCSSSKSYSKEQGSHTDTLHSQKNLNNVKHRLIIHQI